MESPRSVKRRKLDTAPQSPLQQRSTGKSNSKTNGVLKSIEKRTHGTSPHTNGNGVHDTPSKKRDDLSVYDLPDASPQKGPRAPTLLSTIRTATPQRKLARPDLPTSANKPKPPSTPSGVNGLLKRINARIAEKEGTTTREVSIDTATVRDEGSDADTGSNGTSEPRKSSRARRTSKKFLEAFEDEQLERAAKRGAKRRTVEEQMRDIQEESRKPVVHEGKQNETPKSRDSAPLKKTEKKKPGRKAGKKIEEDADDDEVLCKICSKLHSPEKNKIVLCDGCENAYHQRCHKPPISQAELDDPDSEWYCADCTAERSTAVGEQNGTPASGRLKKTPKQIKAHIEFTHTASPMDLDMPDQDQAATPSKAAARIPQRVSSGPKKAVLARPRELSPMILDIPDNELSRITPRKASPLKPRPAVTVTEPEPSNISANLSISISDLQGIQLTVLSQLQSRHKSRLVGLDDEHAKIANLIEQTISAGESNSMLVIGARGSGKTAIVESILQDQTTKQPDAFHAVRLNGFIHTDDKIALREIWRQLGREMDIDDEGSKNYADTLTTLLALLSHPSELGQETDQVTKSVVFILDEFELFATHPRQTLLYNLFDIAQSRKAPIAVLGLTTRFDVAEALEKRVKSRFSHRHVHLSLAKSYGTFKEMCQSSLLPYSLQATRISEEGRTVWEALITDLFSEPVFNTHMRQIYYTSKSVPAFNTSMLMAISTLPSLSTGDAHATTSIQTSILLSHIISSSASAVYTLAPPDNKLALLQSLPTLSLALLIAAARLTIIHATDAVTFSLVYEEYKTLASRARIQASAAGAIAAGGGVGRVWSKDVARGAWEGLEGCELVMRESGEKARVDLGLEEIGMSGVELGGVMARWCREI